MAMISDPDAYFTLGCGRCDRFATPDCSARQWFAGLSRLRHLCKETGLQETVKWAHPTYMHAGRNIAILGAFRGDFRLSFMNPGLLKDTHGILERDGPNTRTPGTIRFTDIKRVAAMEPVIRSYLRQLMDHAEAGTKPPKVENLIDMPDEFTEALDGDPVLAEAFHALTPGRQRSYLLLFNSAKQSATRVARIGKARRKIMDGKGASER